MKQQEALLHAAKCETEAVADVLAEERLQAKNLIRAFFFFARQRLSRSSSPRSACRQRALGEP
jgi:hypothetical protein